MSSWGTLSASAMKSSGFMAWLFGLAKRRNWGARSASGEEVSEDTVSWGSDICVFNYTGWWTGYTTSPFDFPSSVHKDLSSCLHGL